MATFTQTAQTIPLVDYAGQMTVTANALTILDAAFCGFSVISKSTTTPPAFSEGIRYLIPSGASSPWDTHADDLVISLNGAWSYLTPNEGWQIRLDSSSQVWRYDGSAWVEGGAIDTGTITAAITASVTQTQGQQALTSHVNEVSVCANANDVVTLPAARAGLQCIVGNNGAQALQVFPASGDDADGGATDASISVAVGGRWIGMALDATSWMGSLGT